MMAQVTLSLSLLEEEERLLSSFQTNLWVDAFTKYPQRARRALALWTVYSKGNHYLFSCDVMLSSNMAASIATEINIHLCLSISRALMCITVSLWTFGGSSARCSRTHIVRMTALDIQVSLCTFRRPCWRTACRQSKRSIVMSSKLPMMQ